MIKSSPKYAKSINAFVAKICGVFFVAIFVSMACGGGLAFAKSTKSKTPKKSIESKESKKESKNPQKEKTTQNDEIEVIHGDEASLKELSQHQKEKELYFLRGRYYELLYEKSQELKNRTKHGWFAGITAGTNQMEINKNKGLGAEINPFAFGLSAGYLRFLGTALMGLRVYGQYLVAFNASPSVADKVTNHLFSFNVDLVGDKAVGSEEGYYIGVFAGVGAGINLFSQKGGQNIDKISVGTVLNFGISATLKYHHRLELGVKIPPSITQNIQDDYGYLLGAMYLASYQYLF
ncbi:outer membrane beta-barrel protein [Helicobacter sp. T3_23-1056]